MAPDNIVLQVRQFIVVDAPLRHRAETGIDAINNLVGSELLQERVARLHLFHRQVGQVKPPAMPEDFLSFFKRNMIHCRQGMSTLEGFRIVVHRSGIDF